MLAYWVERLKDLGLEAKVDESGPARGGVRHGLLHLARGRRKRDYALRFGQNVTLNTVGVGQGGRAPFVLTTYVAPKTSDAFRRAGIQYLDTSGNAWVEFSDVLIDVRGRPRPADGKPSQAVGNLFSSGRAKVVFALLAWPQLWDVPQRGLARAAGVSVGQVNNTLKLLTQAGYTRIGARPGQADLLELWAAAFPTGLAHRITLAHYASDEPIRWAKLTAVTVSGAAAVPDLVRSPAAVLYVDDFDPRMPVVNRWRSDGEPTITVRHKFWTDPMNVAGDGGSKIAPWPLVYADLLASDDPRERAAAKKWRERRGRSDQHP